VIAEVGTSATPTGMVSLKFIPSFIPRSSRNSDEVLEIEVPKNATIAQCKSLMCERFVKNPQIHHLYVCDIWSKPDRPIHHENHTLDQEHIHDTDVLWLAEGPPPLPGQLNLDFQLYFTQEATPKSAHAQTDGSSSPKTDETAITEKEESKAGEKTEEKSQLESENGGYEYDEEDIIDVKEYDIMNVPDDDSDIRNRKNNKTSNKDNHAEEVVSYNNFKLLEAMYLLQSPALADSGRFKRSSAFSVTYLFSLDVHQSTTLLQLKELLITKPALDCVVSPHHLRLWMADRLLRKDGQSLKKLNVANRACITIQILSEPDVCEESDILFYVHRRDTLLRSFETPLQFWFKGSTLSDLRRDVSELMAIPLAELLLVRFLRHNGKWKVLDEEMTNEKNTQPKEGEATSREKNSRDDKPTETSKPQESRPTTETVAETTEPKKETQGDNGKGKKNTKHEQGKRKEGQHKSKQKKAHSQFKPVQRSPFNLRDGDVLVVKDKREDPDNKDDFVSFDLAMKMGHIGRKGRNYGRPNHKRQRKLEKGLKIHVEDF